MTSELTRVLLFFFRIAWLASQGLLRLMAQGYLQLEVRMALERPFEHGR